jgi:hypothetical protein
LTSWHNAIYFLINRHIATPQNRKGTIMFPNLDAEQFGHGYTDECVAKRLAISEREYLLRKKSGMFLESDVRILLAMYKKSFEYLFELRYSGDNRCQA